MDTKKLGQIPGGGGWRVLGRQAGNRNNKKQETEPWLRVLHHAVDDCTRLAYSEQLTYERRETAAALRERPRAFFTEHGITVTAVMTNNGSCCHSHAFAAVLGAGVKHCRTRPCRPQTNGKVERFNRTLATECAYAQTCRSDARAATYNDWLHHYNHH